MSISVAGMTVVLATVIGHPETTPLNVNLLVNGSGDSAEATQLYSDNGVAVFSLDDWTDDAADWVAQQAGWFDVPAFAGTRFIRPEDSSNAQTHQDVLLDLHHGNDYYAVCRAAIRNWEGGTDAPQMRLQFLDAGGDVLDQETTGQILTNAWDEHFIVRLVPEDAVTARVVLESERLAGSDNDGYFDDVQLIITEGLPAVPRFDLSVEETPEGLLATLSDGTAGLFNAWEWEFGDGQLGAGETVQHLYTEPGTYDVRLTVTATNGRMDTVVRAGAIVYGGPEAAAIIKGPYLQWATQDAMTVMWETSAPGDSTLHYLHDGAWRTQSLGGSRTIHEVRVAGFTAAQEVPYFVESTVSGETLTSDEYSFTTSPPPGTPVRLCIWGDNQDRPWVFSTHVQNMLGDEPDLLVALGDVVSTGSVYEQWDDRFLGPLRPLINHVPMYAAKGNHEQDAHWWYDFMALPNNERWYTFEFADIFFLVLDTNYPFNVGSEQYQFAFDALLSDAAQEAKWLFVAHHHPPYSEIWEEPIYAQIRQHLIPLYESAGVDVNFHGHIHDYERGEYVPPHTDRRIWQLQSSGGGGTLWWDDYDGDWEQIDLVIMDTYHYCVVDITPESLTLRAISDADVVIDEFTIQAEPRNGFPPGEEPSTATQFDFDGDLSATFGPGTAEFHGSAASYAEFGTTTDFGISDIDGQVADVMRIVPPFELESIKVHHGAAPNAGGAFVNEYTMVFDILVPQESFDGYGWLGFYNTNADNANDGDAFVRLPDGGIGISGVYDGQIQPDTWHRVALVWELDPGSGAFDFHKYIDGALVGTQASLGSLDGRFSIYSRNDPSGVDYFWLLADDSGDEAPAYISSFFFTDQPLSADAIAELGRADADGIMTEDEPCIGDIDGDGDVDLADLGILLSEFEVCPD
jgi:hypothetical protein